MKRPASGGREVRIAFEEPVRVFDSEKQPLVVYQASLSGVQTSRPFKLLKPSPESNVVGEAVPGRGRKDKASQTWATPLVPHRRDCHAELAYVLCERAFTQRRRFDPLEGARLFTRLREAGYRPRSAAVRPVREAFEEFCVGFRSKPLYHRAVLQQAFAELNSRLVGDGVPDGARRACVLGALEQLHRYYGERHPRLCAERGVWIVEM